MSTSSHRGAAVAVSVGALVFVITIALFLLFIAPSASADGEPMTTAERSADLLDRALVFKTYWTIEALALGLLGAGAFVLSWALPGRRSAPLGWTLLGTGCIANLAMYAFALGSYFEAAQVAATEPALFDVANRAAMAIFFLSNALAFLGIALIFFVEWRREERLVSRGVAGLGALVGLLAGAAGAAGPVVGFAVLPVAGPSAMIGYLALAWLAVRIAQMPTEVPSRVRTHGG